MEALMLNSISSQYDSLDDELIELLPNGIVVINGHGVVVKANPAANYLLGNTLLGRDWIHIIDEAFAPREDDGHEISLKDGRRVNIAINSLSRVPGELIVLTDMTTTRDFEQARNRQQRLAEMGEMTAHLAHQIRTPLSSAMLYTDHLAREGLSIEKKHRCLQQIKSCHNNIEQQIKDLLFFAQGGNFCLQQSGLSQFLTQIEQASMPMLSQAQADLQTDRLSEEFVFSANIDSLMGALLNLIDNALNAHAKHLTLSVEIKPDGFLSFCLSDDGEGIKQTNLDKISKPFFTTRARGTGLGLAVVQAVAVSHGGCLDVTSIENKGSQFTLTIPLIKYREKENESSIDC